MANDVSVSGRGIKTPLLAFISDVSTSTIVIAFLVIAFYFPVFKIPLIYYTHICLTIEQRIFIYFLILLLLYPIGLFINQLSWALLGWMEKYFELFHFKKKCFLTKGTKNYLCFETLVKEYNLTKSNFYERARQCEYFLSANHLKIISEYDSFLGTSILFRNMTLLFFILSIIFFFKAELIAGVLVLALSILFLILNSLVSFYYSLTVLMLGSKLKEKPQTHSDLSATTDG